MQKSDWFRIVLMIGIGFGLSSCATTEDVRILDSESRRLESRVETNRGETESIKKEMAALRQEIQKEISSLQKEGSNLKADLLLRLENLQSELHILTSGVEEYKDFMKKPSKEMDRMKEDLAFRIKILEEKWKTVEEKNRGQEERSRNTEERIKAIEDRLKGMDSKIDQIVLRQGEGERSASGKEPPGETRLPSTGAGAIYKDAYETFQKGDLEGARRKFEAFLKQYPNTELSDNAQFWIGETLYQKKDFEKAILEYEKVIAKYPEGDKVSAALFKQALAFLELGDKTNGRNLLKRVIEKYPQSEQADMAKKRLEAMK